jgi:hypothetical protein
MWIQENKIIKHYVVARRGNVVKEVEMQVDKKKLLIT